MYKKIALISLPKQDLLRPPAAIPILASACEEQQLDYDFYDLNLWLFKSMDRDLWQQLDNNWARINSNQDRDHAYFQSFLNQLEMFVDTIEKSGADMISISVFTNWSAHCAIELIKCVNQRSLRKQITIAIGGTGIEAPIDTIVPGSGKLCEWLLQNGWIDYFLYGEGEFIFRQLLQGNNTQVDGINNYNTKQLDDLDQFPYPSYRKVDPYQYNYIDRPELMINGSRGCVRKCTYCDVARYWPKFRFRTGKSLANELYHTWQTTGISGFEFSDSLINGNLKEFRQLNKTLIALQKQDPTFKITYKGQFICRPRQSFTEKDYLEMRNAGCNYVYVGIETFSDQIRFDMDKKFDSDAIDFHLQMCGKYGIANVFLMIVGYPTETQHDHKLNLIGLKKYQRYAQAGVIKLITFGFTTSILENTPLERLQGELDIVKEFEDFNKSQNWISLQNPELTFNERVRRWIELVELASKLGYNQPRVDNAVSMMQEVLTISKTKSRSKLIPITVELCKAT